MIKDIAFTFYPVKDIPKARAFYEGILGLKPSEVPAEDAMFIEYPVGPCTLAIGCMESAIPSKDGPSASFEVDNFEEMEETLKKNNIPVAMEAMHFPNCSMMTVHDPDGNSVSIHHRKS